MGINTLGDRRTKMGKSSWKRNILFASHMRDVCIWSFFSFLLIIFWSTSWLNCFLHMTNFFFCRIFWYFFPCSLVYIFGLILPQSLWEIFSVKHNGKPTPKEHHSRTFFLRKKSPKGPQSREAYSLLTQKSPWVAFKVPGKGPSCCRTFLMWNWVRLLTGN